MEFVTLSTLPGIIGRYLMMLKVTDILDIAIMVFVFYKALTLIQSTRAASLLKGVLVFLAALMLSMVLNMNSINFIMNQLVRWGVVAMIVLFQPEIRRILEEVGSRRFIAFFSRAEAGTAVEQAIDQTVLACTEMSQSRTGALIVFERENLLDDMVRSGTVLDAAVSAELLRTISSSRISRSKTMRAPVRLWDISVHASTVCPMACSIVLADSSWMKKATRRRLPTCSSTRRISGWNRMMRASRPRLTMRVMM